MTDDAPATADRALEVPDLTVGQHLWQLSDEASGQGWTVGEVVDIKVTTSGETIRATVSDVGPGESDALLAFEPYTPRADPRQPDA